MDIPERIAATQSAAGHRFSRTQLAAAGVAAYGLSHLLFQLFFPADSEARGTLDTILLALGGLLTTIILFGAARRSAQVSSNTAAAWQLLALAHASYLTGDVLWLVIESTLNLQPFPSLADAAYLGYYVLALFAALSLTVKPQSRNEAMKLSLDMGVVILASGTVAWACLFSPILSDAGSDYWALLLSLLYPTLDLMLIWLLVIRLLSHAAPSRGIGVYALSLAAMTVADALFSFESGTGTYVSGASVVDWIFPAGLVLASVGGLLQIRSLRAPDEGVDSTRHAKMLALTRRIQVGMGSGLAYLWIAVLFGVMLAEHAKGDVVSSVSNFHLTALALGVVLVLVLLRQSLTIRDNMLLTERSERLLNVSHILAAPVDVAQTPGRVLVELNALAPSDESYLVLQYDDGLSICGVKSWTHSGLRVARLPLKPDLSALYASHGLVELTEGVPPILARSCAAMVLRIIADGQAALWPGRTVLPMRHWTLYPLLNGNTALGFMVIGYIQSPPRALDLAGTLPAFARTAVACIETSRLRQQQLTAAAANERNRLSRDLHDSVLQAIYGAAMGMRTAEAHAIGKHKPIEDALEYSINLVEGAISEMKALIFMLRPETLMSEGLLVALTKQAQSLCKRHAIDTMVDAQCAEPELSYEAKEAFFRIAIEAVQNTIKHARANRLIITARMRGEVFEMSIVDNGVGFDATRSYKDNLGLVSIRERATQIAASVVFDSAPGKGASVTVGLRIATTPR